MRRKKCFLSVLLLILLRTVIPLETSTTSSEHNNGKQQRDNLRGKSTSNSDHVVNQTFAHDNTSSGNSSWPLKQVFDSVDAVVGSLFHGRETSLGGSDLEDAVSKKDAFVDIEMDSPTKDPSPENHRYRKNNKKKYGLRRQVSRRQLKAPKDIEPKARGRQLVR